MLLYERLSSTSCLRASSRTTLIWLFARDSTRSELWLSDSTTLMLLKSRTNFWRFGKSFSVRTKSLILFLERLRILREELTTNRRLDRWLLAAWISITLFISGSGWNEEFYRLLFSSFQTVLFVIMSISNFLKSRPLRRSLSISVSEWQVFRTSRGYISGGVATHSKLPPSCLMRSNSTPSTEKRRLPLSWIVSSSNFSTLMLWDIPKM